MTSVNINSNYYHINHINTAFFIWIRRIHGIQFSDGEWLNFYDQYLQCQYLYLFIYPILNTFEINILQIIL